jgi:ribosome-associated toxin RatA of RatAB toxin-antitoxin module
MKRTILANLITAALLLALPAEARPSLSPERMERLKKGEVLVFSDQIPESSIQAGKAIAMIPDLPEAVVYVILRVDKYKHFLPRVKDSRITKYQKNHTYAVVETELPWPFKDCWAYVQFTRVDKAGRTFELRWKMLNGTMKEYSGSALIEPWNEDATKSVVTYKIKAIPLVSAPDATISKGLRKVASIFLHRIRMRLEALRKFKKLPEGL